MQLKTGSQPSHQSNPIQYNPLQSMDGSDPCPTLRQGNAGVANKVQKQNIVTTRQVKTSQTVRLCSHCSGSTPCPVGVPQGSVLGPFLFTIYTSPISHIAESHNIKQHQPMTHNFSWLSPQVMYLLKYPLLNLVSHHYKPGFVLIVCV